MMEDGTANYYRHITATCTEKAVFDTFGGWVLDPPIEDIQPSCLHNGFCNFQRGKPPILVDKNDKKVNFAPFDNFLAEPQTKYQPLEIGGRILVYCKGMGK